MALIPATSVTIRAQLRTRECGFYGNETNRDELYANFHKPQLFERLVDLGRYAIDLTPVTNGQFAEFLRFSNYHPRYPENFLKQWTDRNPPIGMEDHPVVYVGLEDARAYGAWAGKQLPTEEQWQYAAQGSSALRYPWGDAMEPGLCNGGETGTTTSVTAFPDGRSPFGCYDMCGNTWEWTESERTDGRTRSCMIRGGSYSARRVLTGIWTEGLSRRISPQSSCSCGRVWIDVRRLDFGVWLTCKLCTDFALA